LSKIKAFPKQFIMYTKQLILLERFVDVATSFKSHYYSVVLLFVLITLINTFTFPGQDACHSEEGNWLLCGVRRVQQIVISMISVTAHWDLSKEWEQLVISLKSGNSLLFAWRVAATCSLLDVWQQLVKWQQLVIYLKSENSLWVGWRVTTVCYLSEEWQQPV
jgi:hypothetical protein